MSDPVFETLAYYNANAADFIDATLHVDFKEIRNRFLSLLPVQGSILDLGCGSGRDSKAFLEQGYSVIPQDGSEEICKAAENYLGIPVRHQLFSELSDQNAFDGIWACASLLHLPKSELPAIFSKIHRALKDSGAVYVSFKQANPSGFRNGRYFTNLSLQDLQNLIEQCGGWKIEALWTSQDVRDDRPGEFWSNALLRKI